MRYTIEHQSVLDWSDTYLGPKFHALITDSPYHLTSIVERFGGNNSAPAKFGNDGAFARASRGFMNATWDGGDIAFRPETWAKLGRHLYDGAFCMSFASTRGFHRMAVAIEGLIAIPHNEILEAADMLKLARMTKDWSIVEDVENWLRTHARLTTAIASAGFIIHPTIFCWGFGSGFPKATRLDTTIDERAFQDWLDNNPDKKEQLEAFRVAALQAKRAAKDFPAPTVQAIAKATEAAYKRAKKQIKEDSGFARVVGKKAQTGAKFKQAQALIDNGGFNDPDRADFDLTEATTDLARQWAGHRYGLQALKPALEPIIVFQKPYSGDPVSSITATGAGAWNIDAGRIGTEEWTRVDRTMSSGLGNNAFVSAATYEKRIGQERTGVGRWPSNLILSHSPLCADECVPDCPVRRLGEQSGEGNSTITTVGAGMGYYGGDGERMKRGYVDSGTAARFFFNADYALDRLEDSDPLLYVAKASSAERDAGLENGTIEGRERVEITFSRAHIEGESEWEYEGHKVALLVDTAVSPPRVIDGFTIQNNNAIEWNTILFGSNTTAPFLADSKSITLTEISSTTTLETLNYLIRSLTSESIAAVSCETGSGGNPVENAESCNPYLVFTNLNPVSLPGVKHVMSGTRLIISASEKLFAHITINDGRKTPIDNAYQRGETSRFNPHATIKPIALIKHLASLLLPPEGYESRLLIPFSGAGSEMIGALLAGWQHVTGIELEAKHVDVARLRLDWWLEASRLSLSTEPKEILEKIDPATPAIELNRQLTLMDLMS